MLSKCEDICLASPGVHATTVRIGGQVGPAEQR
jgi:hypothetical protein